MFTLVLSGFLESGGRLIPVNYHPRTLIKHQFRARTWEYGKRGVHKRDNFDQNDSHKSVTGESGDVRYLEFSQHMFLIFTFSIDSKILNMLHLLLFASFLSLFSTYNAAELIELRNAHYPQTLTNLQLNYVADLSNSTHLNEALDHICIPRVVGTPGHNKVHNYIVSELKKLGWNVEIDSFDEETPTFGMLRFRNIVATLNSDAERYLVLACHYDSKYFQNFDFVGATDSAVPCAMMLNLASVMRKELKAVRNDVDLKFIFFDGEEAFRRWEPKDSIYGARHLAAKYEQQEEITPRGLRVTRLDRIDMLVLLDLLGTPNPHFSSYFGDTNRWYFKLVEAEQRLRKRRLLEKSSRYFLEQQAQGFIEDDHVPFLQRGVPILHIIPTPFPKVWHKATDNREAIDIPTTEDLNKILRVFVVEYLHLDIEEDDPDDEDTQHVEL